MKTWAHTVDLADDPDVWQRYDAEHAAIWPEVAASLQSVGMRQIRIWRLRNRLFMLVETDDDFDPEAAGATHRASHARCAEWEELMASFQRRMPGVEGKGKWALMDQVFQLHKADEE